MHRGAGDKFDTHMEVQQGIRARGLSELKGIDPDLYHDTSVAISLAGRLTQLASASLKDGVTGELSMICKTQSLPPALVQRAVEGYERIGEHLDGMRRRCAGREQLVFLSRDERSGPAVGQAAPSDPHKRIFLSPCFSESSIVQKAITLIHESSHLALGTEDEHYFGQSYFRYDVLDDARNMRQEILAHVSLLSPMLACEQFFANADSWAFSAALIGFKLVPEEIVKVADQERLNQ